MVKNGFYLYIHFDMDSGIQAQKQAKYRRIKMQMSGASANLTFFLQNLKEELNFF